VTHGVRDVNNTLVAGDRGLITSTSDSQLVPVSQLHHPQTWLCEGSDTKEQGDCG